ncbi:DUF4307 domain-containing protein [Gulosibacter faecalis]|uniref:DUF4307 domain-containing protein n=1 Tax=Gulosibacter faecalis TaxID=272240 RepID=A0ABW5UXS1_9MICO|nr:DUF4307 domain-containing protein [Gulosibacter faecalis]
MTDLDTRYGRTRTQRRSPRWLWGGLFGVLVAGVIAFWGFSQLNAAATIEAQTGGFTVASDSEVSVTARVSVQPGTPVACALEATNTTQTVVGYKVVELEAATEQHRTVHVTLRTTGPAVGAAVAECWVLDGE